MPFLRDGIHERALEDPKLLPLLLGEVGDVNPEECRGVPEGGGGICQEIVGDGSEEDAVLLLLREYD